MEIELRWGSGRKTKKSCHAPKYFFDFIVFLPQGTLKLIEMKAPSSPPLQIVQAARTKSGRDEINFHSFIKKNKYKNLLHLFRAQSARTSYKYFQRKQYKKFL
jgi:hypothetical protein